MEKKKQFRNNGAVGALLDEYEKCIGELCTSIWSINSDAMKTIVDQETKDPNCRSIQTILTHVVSAGYAYSKYILEWNNKKHQEREIVNLENVQDYISALEKMFDYCEQVFVDNPEMEIEIYENDKKILTRWGQYYDVEQLLEHAIVHILRHRRQIERFLEKINDET